MPISDKSASHELVELRKKILDYEKSNQFFEMLVRCLPGLFYLFDSNFRMLKWNRNLELTTGLTAEEIAARSWLDLFEGDELAKIRQAIQSVFDSNQGAVEAAITTDAGEKIPFHFTGASARIDNESYLIGMGLDLSAHKKTINDLRESEALYRLMAERMTEGVILLNNYKILFANKTFLSIFQYEDIRELVGRDLRELIASEFEMYFKDMCEELEAGFCRERFFQARWLTRNKTVLWVEGIGNRLEWKGLPTVFLTVRDITEAKRKEIFMQKEADILRRQNVKLRSSIQERYRFDKIVGKSPAMKRIYEQILNVSGTQASVVIYGESGTGKELVARAIHNMSRRAGKAFVPVNSSAIPESLLESEFFGHKRGAFTGATADRSGYLDMANGGTLFLDEVGDLNIHLQAKLLRALEEGTYSPVGSSVIKHSDFRLISATNKDLKKMLANGEFREDFFYRIHILPITIPPLRDRREDIPLIAEDFLEKQLRDNKMITFSGPVLESLMRYDWPGNVRELQNAIQRYLASGSLDFLETDVSDSDGPGANDFPLPPLLGDDSRYDSLKENLQAVEDVIVQRTLRACRGNKQKAAKTLKISRKTLDRKLERQFQV